MTTDLSGADDRKAAELDEVWARWAADTLRRNRERQQTVTQLAIVIALAIAIWLTAWLVRG